MLRKVAGALVLGMLAWATMTHAQAPQGNPAGTVYGPAPAVTGQPQPQPPAQQQPGYAQATQAGPVTANQPAAPNQPVVPNPPTIQPAQPGNGKPTEMPPPFTLTPQEEAVLNNVLEYWEKSTTKVKDFTCKFRRQEFLVTLQNKNDPNYDPKKPTRENTGELRYGAPDRGMYRVDGDGPEKWICDGRSIFAYDYSQKVQTEYKLPQHLWGKAISDGPIPFLFGQSPAKIKQRYFVRIITPEQYQKHQIWIQAFPRFSPTEFNRAELVLSTKDMMPLALRTFANNGVDNTVHYFSDVVVNNLLGFLAGDPFKPTVDRGWKKEVIEAPPPQSASAQAASNSTTPR